MGIFSGFFNINLDDKHYISAITTYQPHAVITSLLEDDKESIPVDPKVPLHCSALTAITTEMRARGILTLRVGYTVDNNMSLLNIFPTISQEYDMKPSLSSDSKLEHAKNYMDDQIAYITSDFEVIQKSSEPFHGTLYKEEALYLLKTLGYSKALELSQRSGCIFIAESGCIYLGWGKKLSIRSISNLTFHLNDGFVSTDDDSGDKRKQDVTKALQEQFLLWKNHGYEGPLFSQHMSFTEEIDDAAANHCPCLSFFSRSKPGDQPVSQIDLLDTIEPCAIL